MRSALLTCSLLPAIVGAQALPYRRVEALGPAVPDGSAYPYGLTDDGWALIATEASNLNAPARFPGQFYFRSPEGTLIRIPLERAGEEAKAPWVGILSRDGAFAVMGGPLTPLVLVNRAGPTVRLLPSNTMRHIPIGIVGRQVFSTVGYSTTLVKTDLDTGAETIYPPLPETSGSPIRISPDGTKAIYSAGFAFFVRNLSNGLVRKVFFNSPVGSAVVDSDGRYAWIETVFPGNQGRFLLRRDMYTGTETIYPLPTVNLPIDLRAASNRFAFFETEAALSPDDTNGTSDFYAFDRSENVYRLISSRQGLRQAAGGVTDFATSPKGNHTIFGSAAPGVSDLVPNGFGQLYARSTIRFDTRPGLVAVGPGGREAREAVASRNGTAVFINRFVSGQWSLRILVDGQPPRVLPTSSEMRPLDVIDDGSRALFMGETTGELVLWENGIFRPLQAGGFYGNFGKIDPKTGIPVVVLDRNGPTGLQQELIRFDPLTGIGTRIDTQAPIVYYGFDVDAGRVAWKTLDSIRVLDLTTGASLQIPQIRDRFYGPRLTSDGVYVGVAQTLANGDPEATRVYRVSDGSLRRNLSFGELLPDGKWLSDSERGELIQASNGARISDTIPLDETLGGTPVGPLRFTFRKVRREEGPYPGDLWRYRAVALPLPATTSHGAYPTADGHASLEATFRKAGLENASTWNEYRIDGAGGWRRIKTGTNASVQLTPGRHRIEIRAADALGRVEAVPKESYVVADFDPPTFGAIEVVPEFGYLEIETDAFDGTLKVLRSDRSFESTSFVFRQGKVLCAYLGVIEPGVIYRFRFLLRDPAGKEVLTPERIYP